MKKCKKCHEKIQDGAKKCKHCGTDLRNWFVRHKVITAFLVIFLFIIIVNSFGSSDQQEQETNLRQPNQANSKQVVDENRENNNKEGIVEDLSKPEKQIEQTVKNEPVQKQEPELELKAKTYQQIFSFSGNGSKNSEPFIITGSRFKVAYNCTGDLCQAWLNNASDGSLAELIMNTLEPSIQDETIIYSSGEYFIQANTLGSYSFTVFDYK